MNASPRKLIGKSTSLVGREAVWQVSDGLEIQSKEHYEVVRRRVLFEDVLFVTHHRRYGAAYLVTTGVIALFFLTIAVAIIAAAGTDVWPATIPLLVIGLPPFLAFILRLMFRLDIITVFGRRTKAAIRFGIRKKRARETYQHIVNVVGTAQARLAREWAAEAPPAEPVAPMDEQPPMPPAPE